MLLLPVHVTVISLVVLHPPIKSIVKVGGSTIISGSVADIGIDTDNNKQSKVR
ncbi:unnamed protein product [marine sediment metagenome]|uniref:Uncharacterized protein n=1 Tax=marine sediment metagenome TaxID=412755 RepID=X1K922_9ZZZZ